MGKVINVDKFDKEGTEEIMVVINSLKNVSVTEKEVNLVLDSTTGDYQNSIKIARVAITNGVRVNVICEGSLDASSAIVSALAKCTGGKSVASFSTDFCLSQKANKSGKSLGSISADVKDRAVLKTLKHLKCKSKLLADIFQSGEIISADLAKHCGIVTEVQLLPAIKVPAKKAKKADGDKTEKSDKTEEDSKASETDKVTEGDKSDKEVVVDSKKKNK